MEDTVGFKRIITTKYIIVSLKVHALAGNFSGVKMYFRAGGVRAVRKRLWAWE